MKHLHTIGTGVVNPRLLEAARAIAALGTTYYFQVRTDARGRQTLWFQHHTQNDTDPNHWERLHDIDYWASHPYKATVEETLGRFIW